MAAGGAGQGERHSRRAVAALRRLGEDDPALGALALWCAHRDAGEGAGDGEGQGAAAWTDGRTIYYGPGFEVLAPHEQTGLAAHQILHVAFRHVARGRALAARFGAGFDARLFNLATDAILNQTLVLAGHALPRPAVLLAPLLADTLEPPPPGRSTARPDPADALSRWDAEALYVALVQPDPAAAPPGQSGDGRRKAEAPGQGGGRSQMARTARAHAEAQGFRPDLKDAPGGGADRPEDEAEAAADWRQRLLRAMEIGRLAGRGIGAQALQLADLPQSRVPWEVLLRGLMARALRPDPRPDALRPARRWIAAESAARAAGRPVPGFEAAPRGDRAVPRIAVCIDTSTSIDDARLGLFAAQIAGIGRRSGAEVHVLPFDEAVQGVHRMQGLAWESEIRRIRFFRGGGTDFRSVIAASLRLAPSAIVILTDLDGPAGPAPVRVPVIWAVPADAPALRPPFGRVLSLAR